MNLPYSPVQVHMDRDPHQLTELDRLLEFLEQMNLRDQSRVPSIVVDGLRGFGIEGGRDPSPSSLIPKILGYQQVLRRRAASIRRSR